MSPVRTVETSGRALPEGTYPALAEALATLAARHPEWLLPVIPGGVPVPATVPPIDLAAAPGTVNEPVMALGAGSTVLVGDVTVRAADVVVPGRPGVVSVVATVRGRTVHAVLGLRPPGAETFPLPDADEAPVGILDLDDGLAVVSDALTDAQLCQALLGALLGEDGDIDRVRRAWMSDESTAIAYDDRVALAVYGRLPPEPAPHPGLEMYLALDEAGFNHVAAPIARWRRGQWDLGVVHEYEPGAAGGWALALTSLRDLYASGGPPERAGADFGPEARRLGRMTARLHLGLDAAFGRRSGDVAAWVDAVERSVAPVAPELLGDPEVADLLATLRSVAVPCPAIRTHGDFHLGRVERTDLGWFVFDFSPGGTPVFGAGTVPPGLRAGADAAGPVYRSPLADVADMLWSFRHVADTAAAERDPTGRLGLASLARLWEVRNRRAFLSGYLATPGIRGLVPPARGLARNLAAAFELERTAAKRALHA